MDVTDEHGAIIEPLIPEAERHPRGPGRPWRAARDVLNGVWWIVRTGARWQDLPDRDPSYQTCHRRFPPWVDGGGFDHRVQAIADDWLARGQRARSDCFIDGTTPSGHGQARDPQGEGTKIMAMADGAGLALAIHVESAAPHEVTRVAPTLAACFVDEHPERLSGDKASDSDPLDTELAADGIEMIAPHRSNRTKLKTQDGRPLRRYKRR